MVKTNVSCKLDGEIEAIETDLLNGPVMHTDETPMDVTQKPDYSEGVPVLCRSEQTSFTAYIRTHSNDRSTLYTLSVRLFYICIVVFPLSYLCMCYW